MLKEIEFIKASNMKTRIKLISIIFLCLTTFLGCSKDDSPIPCGKITDILISYSYILEFTIYNHLTVELPDGSKRYDTVEVDDFNSDAYNIGDEYCEATETTTPYR